MVKKLLKGLCVYSLNLSLFFTGNHCLKEVMLNRIEVNLFILLLVWLLWAFTSWIIIVAVADVRKDYLNDISEKFSETRNDELEDKLHCSIGGKFEVKESCSAEYGRFIIYLGRSSSGEACVITKEGERNIPFESMLNYMHVGWPEERSAEYLVRFEKRISQGEHM